MSVLLHLCRRCAHPVSQHHPAARGYTACPCCLGGDADPDPAPIERPTFRLAHADAEPLHAPGSRRNAGTMHAETLCDCAACVAVHAQRRAAAADGG